MRKKETTVHVIGIDVGPAKGGHVCNGEAVYAKTPAELYDFLMNLPDDVLVAWDAPLTGPSDPDASLSKDDLTRRPIERFFMSGSYKPPKGISVLPYSGCSHWTISRRLLGLPRVGPYDVKTELPFRLVVDDRPRPLRGRHVVEVHPAVALWRWCESEGYGGPWIYKKQSECRQAIAERLARRLEKRQIAKANSDDHLDAWVAWALARLWLDGDKVMLLGNLRTGSLLLPFESAMREAFTRFEHSAGKDLSLIAAANVANESG